MSTDAPDLLLAAPADHLPAGDGRPRSALAVVPPASTGRAAPAQLMPNEAAGYLMLGSDAWNQLREQCTVLVKDGALHRSINTPGKAMMIAMKAIEMGVPLTAAWTGMRFIDGEVCIQGKLALRLIQQRVVSLGGVCKPIAVAEGEDWKRAGWMMARPGEEPTAYWFTMEDAQRAGLLELRGKMTETMYAKYGNRMLRWRALATGAAYEFADILQGCMLAEEMEHKDPAVIAAQQLRAAQASGGGQRDQVERKPGELGREHPEVAKMCALVHQFAQRYARLHADEDTDPESCYKEARRAKWQDLTDRCIRGDAPTQEEARTCQSVLADDIRHLDEAIRVQDEAAAAAQKADSTNERSTDDPGSADPRPT